MRLVSGLFVLFLSSWGITAALGAEEEKETAPFHDLEQLLQASMSGEIEVPSRRDVLLLKTYDGDPTLGRGADKGLLLREVVRQALLLAAREELGLPTRDQTLREPFPEVDPGDTSATDSAAGSIQIVSSVPGRFPNQTALRVSVFRERASTAELLWEKQIEYPKPWWMSLERLANQLEEWSRNELVTVLKEAGFEGKPNRLLDEGPVPDEVLNRRDQWNTSAQFFAVRSLHRLIREDGESPERLAALAESYARLGTLTAWHWGPAHQAFKARALLYSQRLMVRTTGSPQARETRAYVLALLGRHHYALAVPLARLKAAGVELSGTAQVVDAFCRFEEERLTALAEQPELGPLVRYLRFLAVEPTKNRALIGQTAEALLADHPDCFLAIDALASGGDLGPRLGAARDAVMTHVPALYGRLSRETDLPPGARDLVKRGSEAPAGVPGLDAQQLNHRRELIAALREFGAVANDQVEPSLACFAQLVLEEGFAAAARAVHAQRFVLGVPAEQMPDVIRGLSPLLEGHPYEDGIRSYGWSPAENRRRIPEFLAWIDPAEFGTAIEPMAMALTKQHPPAWEALVVPALDHLDLVYRDLVLQVEEGPDWGGYNATRQLERVSPHSPMQAVGQLRYRWHVAKVAKQADRYEERFGDHPAVLTELGRRYRESENWAGAERVLARLVELEPTQRAYQELAAVYEQQQQRDKWLETLEAYLQMPETGLSHARVRVNIADYYMAQGDYQAALPYAEEAAQTWAAWAMSAVIRCHEALGNLPEAEAWHRRRSQRYDTTAFEWYYFCRRNGFGDVRAAQERAENYIQSLDGAESQVHLTRVAMLRLLSGDADEGLEVLRQLYDRDKNPFTGLHAALTADQLGQTELRDTLLQRIIQQGTEPPVAAEKAATVQLAEMLQKALKGEEQPQLDRSAVDELVRGAPPGEPTNLNYFVGKFLWLHEQQEVAEAYLRMAARSPERKFNRDLAGALLRDHGVDREAVSREEPVPQPQ